MTRKRRTGAPPVMCDDCKRRAATRCRVVRSDTAAGVPSTLLSHEHLCGHCARRGVGWRHRVTATELPECLAPERGRGTGLHARPLTTNATNDGGADATG